MSEQYNKTHDKDEKIIEIFNLDNLLDTPDASASEDEDPN
jgi:hypothetical protein